MLNFKMPFRSRPVPAAVEPCPAISFADHGTPPPSCAGQKVIFAFVLSWAFKQGGVAGRGRPA